MSKDTIYRQDAIDALSQYPFEKVVNCISIIEELPSAQPEYTENEEKVLVMMFTIVKNILDLQDGYMDIDCTIFGHNELFDLSQKIGIDY